MTAVVLHLSDIHIRGSRDWILDKGERIAACTYSVLPDASAVFIVVSGDIAFSGKREQYEAARGLFSEIQKCLVAERPVPVHFVLAPGNHDCDFERSNKARLLALNGVRAEPSDLDASIVDIGTSVQVDYNEFAESLHSPNETRAGDKLWTCHRFTIEEKEVVFDSLNVAWCSNLHEEPGTLIFPHENYSKYLEEVVDLRITILHHPLNWFHQATYHPLRRLIRSVANVVVSGHEHVGGVGEEIHSNSGNSAYIEGCVLQGASNVSESSFNVAVLNLEEGTFCSTRYQWSQDGNYAATEEGSWADFRSLPKKTRNRFVITKKFESLLADPGGAFTAQGSPISLSDLYVYPDMQEPLERDSPRRFVSTSILLDPTRIEKGVLLAGEEKVGATSLLYMLFRSYHERGLIPLYIRGADIKGRATEDLDLGIGRAVAEQYGEGCLEKYKQAPAASKVLLVDDFDDGPIKAAQYRASMLAAVCERFPKFVVTVNELFDFEGSIRPHAREALSDMQEYNLLPFGYTRRAHLVRRWFQRTAMDGSLSDDELLSKCDQGERFLDAVMARNIVPALPLYLVTLLQSFDVGSSNGFEESGLGDYYDFLVKEGLRSAGIPKNQWGAFIEYCSHLAWQLHATERKEISTDELKRFNDQFSKEQHRVNLEQRLAQLTRARVLSKSGDYIRFRYHYIFYFLKGRFLASQLDDLAVRAHIQECCAHLYVRENANTILFLAHHAFKSPMFLECIVDAINAPFQERSPICFANGDTEPLKEFVEGLPRLQFSGETPEQARERLNRLRDENDDGNDGLVDEKAEDAEHNFIAQLISLFKTVEILGQILKNQIASVPRTRRVELLVLLMKGPLRALGAYFDLFMKDKDEALLELGELLAKSRMGDSEEKRREMALKVLSFFLQASAFGFLLKAVVSVSSEALLDDIESAAKRIDSPAARLIAVGVRLDSPADLPRAAIKKLMKETSGDFIAARVLQHMALRRLYMFRTSTPDKQWLESQEMLNMKIQNAAEFRARSPKLLK